MYRIASLNNWINGKSFVGMVAAVQYARECKRKHPNTQFDVMRDCDNKTTSLVFAADGNHKFVPRVWPKG